jgi:microsomal dipeptidase-like Zn-dependent dipeptidase
MPIAILRPPLVATTVVLALVLVLLLPAGSAHARPGAGDDVDPSTPARSTPYRLVDDWDVENRLPQPEDRYALAGGCYAIEVPGSGFVARDGDGLHLAQDRSTAEPFHFQATRLGEYLIATNEGPETRWEDADWDVRGYLSAAALLPEVSLRGTGIPAPGEGLFPAAPLPDSPTTDDLAIAAEPSAAGDWRIAAAGADPEARVRGTEKHGNQDGSRPRPPGVGTQTYVLTLSSAGKAIGVDGGALTLTEPAEAAEVAFHLVAPGAEGAAGAGCARWPEVDTNTSGPPAPTGKGLADEVEGFFESHVHGMAFEFLGGELRCGRPWHPYGVEYAIGDCREDGNIYNGILEVPLSGADPTDPVFAYDPVGWPTFEYWPRNRTLTHEQFYWRWLERAHHGGLRLLTNLLVDNTSLCQTFPVKRNSCNEMDGVRLQAQRIHELEGYIDAQYGGPGEGWFRIVTSPTQARETINAGRLAVVLGVENSGIFDCEEFLDRPGCTAEEIDERLDELYDMGVRQLQIVNKFDNALTGVTGDGGTTGVVVNSGNRGVTGHWWDMQTCEPDDHHHDGRFEGHEHDKLQLNPRDDAPGFSEVERDVLAGIILDTFGATRGYAGPVYPEGPHCNTRGLTELGEHTIRGMLDRGFIFDPDHMSAAGMRSAFDLIEHEIIPERQAEAAAGNRPATIPGLMSSHSWANDVVYQRIYALGGVVAPYANSPDSYVRDWTRRRRWFDWHAPAGAMFGIGYGADTNGLGGQPPARREAAVPTDYAEPFPAPIGDVLISQQRSGFQPFDVNTQGVSHYGLFADWFNEVRLAADELAPEMGGGDAIIRDMLAAPEVYLRMWERAVYGGSSCVDDQSSLQVEDLHALLGLNVEGFLTAAGQPLNRDGAAYVYCTEDDEGHLEVVEVHFDDDGIAAAVQPASVSSWLEARRAGVDGAHDHGPAAMGIDGHGHDGGPAGAVLLLGMGAMALCIHPSRRRLTPGHLAVGLPVLVVLAYGLA